jgi:hypothetical protein
VNPGAILFFMTERRVFLGFPFVFSPPLHLGLKAAFSAHQ